MMVYVLTGHEYEEHWVVGVFSSNALAEQRRNKLTAANALRRSRRRYVDYDIDELEVDEEITP